MKSFEWWYAQRARPFDLIPQGAFQRANLYAKASMKRESKHSPDGIETSQWRSLGPHNIGGRVLAIAINPSNPSDVWVGSASGGLWRSLTGGEGYDPWNYQNTGFNTLSVSAIAIDPIRPNVIYIGTGEISLYHRPLIGTPGARASYGMGILKSTDGGASWNQTGLTFTFPEITAVQKIVINPENTNTIYTATSEGVFKSGNAGISWTKSDSVLMAMDVVMDPSDTSILYASHGNLNSSPNPGLYKTTDAGSTWTRLTNGLPSVNFGRTALSISPTNPNTVYAGVANAASSGILGLYKTTNGGTTWSLVSTTNYVGQQGWYDNVVAVHPTNPDTVFCSGLHIYKSNSGGNDLTTINPGFVHVDHHAIAFDPTNPRIIYFGTDGGIYKTKDGGTSFFDLNNGFLTTQFYPGFATSVLDSTPALGGLQDNGTLKYFGSQFWMQVLGGDGGWCAIDPTNSSIMYYEYQYLGLYKSTSGGFGGSSITNGLPTGSANANFIAPFTIAPSSTAILYAGNKNVYKSTNGGDSWFAPNGAETINGTNISYIAVSPTDPDKLLASTGSGALGDVPLFEVYSSTNGGQTWQNVTGSLPDRYPTHIEFDPTSNSTAWVTYSGYGTPHLFKTTDFGQNWQNISSNLPDIPHQAIAVDPELPNQLYVGTDLGVYHSSDGGASWEDFNAGMPPAMVLDLTVSRTTGTLRAATFGNGIYDRPLVRQPVLSLTYPAGGEILASGVTETIRWSQRFLRYVKIEYSTNNGTSWDPIINSTSAATGLYDWLVPSTSTTQGRIRISDAESGAVVDSTKGTFTVLVNPDVLGGWNLLSIDHRAGDPRKSTLFPTAVSEAYAYKSRYIIAETLLVGKGYWLKFSVPQYVSISGEPVTTDTVDVRAGWNIIGAISNPIATNSIVKIPPTLSLSRFYGYTKNYFVVDTLKPLRGYWVKSRSDGKLVLGSSMLAKDQREDIVPLNELTSLQFSDARGNKQTLYVATQSQNIQADEYELPPPPPSGSFDVRFSSQRMVEVVLTGGDNVVEFAMIVSTANYPLHLEGKITHPELDLTLRDDEGHSYTVGANDQLVIAGKPTRLLLYVHTTQSRTTLPHTYELKQNYPNPFNPTTDVRYAICDMSRVSLKVYDVLGREVATLVDEVKQPGEYTVRWNASEYSSGIYFCKLTAGGFTETKKMLLIR